MKVRIRNIIISLLIFVIGMSGDFIMSAALHKREVDTIKTRSQLNAQIYGNAIKNQIIRAKDLTRIIQYAVIAGNGDIKNYDHMAKKWIDTNQYVSTVQIAPNGVVSHSYPDKDGEKYKVNLFEDPNNGAIVKYGMKNDTTTIQGPFKLENGGYGYAVTNPVSYMKDGKKTIWGFAIVIIDADKLIDHYSHSLEALHYKFNLCQKNINDQDYKIIGGEKKKLVGAKSYSFGYAHCKWKFYVMPEKGYIVSESVKMIFILFFGVILLLSYLVYIMLVRRKQQKLDRKQAITDYLTGLLNRNGFDESVNRYLQTNNNMESSAMIMLDIDDFKYVNDLHGHRVGDLVLKNLANQLVSAFGQDSIVGRNGGDEFCIFIKYIDNLNISSRLNSFASQVFRVYDQGKEIHYTISLGYVLYPEQANEYTPLMRCADASLYFMKLNHKKGAAMYHDGMLEIKRERLGFNLKDIAVNLPGAFMIYSLKDSGRVLFANSEMIHDLGCNDDEEFLEYVHHAIFSIIEDPDRIIEDLRHQLYDPKGNRETSVTFYMRTKDGRRLHMHERARLVSNEFFGDIIYATLLKQE